VGIITGIEHQKNRNRYKIHIDSQYFASLDEEVLVRNKLKVGMEVDEEALGRLIYENDLRQAFDKSLSYLGYRARSRKEVSDYLARKGFGEAVIEETLEKLEGYRFVNDRDFANMWVSNRKTSKLTAKRVINQELKEKGISAEIVESALSAISPEDELKAATQLAVKYIRKYEKLDNRERIYKTGQALARKGFGWEVIRKAIKRASDDTAEMEDWEE